MTAGRIRRKLDGSAKLSEERVSGESECGDVRDRIWKIGDRGWEIGGMKKSRMLITLMRAERGGMSASRG